MAAGYDQEPLLDVLREAQMVDQLTPHSNDLEALYVQPTRSNLQPLSYSATENAVVDHHEVPPNQPHTPLVPPESFLPLQLVDLHEHHEQTYQIQTYQLESGLVHL